MASSSSSTKKKNVDNYRLVQLEIENFKSIKKAIIKISSGMTCITGANGVGKSNILEAIVFGLGAPLTSLRSQNLTDLAHATDSKMQIVVQLTFNQSKDVKIIGSSIINGQRIYHINENKKLVTKQFFLQTTGELGFSKDPNAWYLSQRAVDAIVKATPQKMVETLCFLAGTDLVLSAQEEASKLMVKFQANLQAVSKVIASLEHEVTEATQRLSVFDECAKMEQQLRSAEEAQANAEHVHSIATRQYDLTKAVAAIHSFSKLRKQEDALVRRHQQHQVEVNHLDGLAEAEQNVTRAQTQLSKEEGQLKQLKTVLNEHLSQQTETEKSCLEKQTKAIAIAAERERILSADIPQLIARITSGNNDTRTTAGGGPNAATILATKRKQARNACDVAQRTESLFVALSAEASQKCSELTKIETNQRTLLGQQEELIERARQLTEHLSDINNHAVNHSEEDYRRVTEEMRSAQAKFIATRDALSLPDLCNTHPEGDFGFMADIIQIDTSESAGMLALETLLSPVFSVRVCLNNEIASKIIVNTSQNRHRSGLRIWPVEQLQVTTRRSQAFMNTLAAFPTAIDPLSRLRLRPELPVAASKALFKAVGNVILVDTDETAMQVISFLQTNNPGAGRVSGCLSMTTGNKHTIGSLSVPHRPQINQQSRQTLGVQLIAQYQQQRQTLAALQHQLATIEQQRQMVTQRTHDSHELYEVVQPNLADVKSELDIIQGTVQSQRNRVLATQTELAAVRARLEEAEQTRDRIQAELLQLEKASEDTVGQLAESQNKNRKAELIAQRDAMEKHAGVLSAVYLEHEAELRRLESTKVTLGETIATLNECIAQSESTANRLRDVVHEAQKRQEECACLVAKNREAQLVFERKKAEDDAKIAEIRQQMKDDRASVQTVSVTYGLKLSSVHGNGRGQVVSDDEEAADAIELGKALKKANQALLECLDNYDNGTTAKVQSALPTDQSMVMETRARVVESRELVISLVSRRKQLRQQLHQSKGTTRAKNRSRSGDVNSDDSDDDEGSNSKAISRRTASKHSVELESLQRRRSQLDNFNEMLRQTKQSIAALDGCTGSISETIENLHRSTYEGLRQRCCRYFGDLAPGKHVDLVAVGERLEDGLKFVLLPDTGSNGTNGPRSTSELSGGQRSLLGLAFIFAAALHRKSPLYLLDECDAALDEGNQSAIGAVIAKIFEKNQVICVSHHVGFQQKAGNLLAVQMHDGVSVIG